MTVVSEFTAVLAVQSDQASFAKAESSLTRLASVAGTVVGTLGALFAGRQAVGFVNGLIDKGDALNDMVLRTGLAGQSLQALGLAAEQNGSSLEELGIGLKFLQRNSVEASEGSKTMAKAFSAVGISGAELKAGVPTEELLNRLADAMAAQPDPAKRTAMAMQLLGRSGQALVPVLSQGRAGLDEVRKKFVELGGGLSDEVIKAADETRDRLAELHVATLSLSSVLGSSLIPVITSIVTKMTAWAVAIQQLLKGNEFLQIGLAITTAAFVAWGVVMLWAQVSAVAPILAGIAAVTLVLDDLNTGLTGGRALWAQWADSIFGIGSADTFVKNWADGIDILIEKLKGLGQVAVDVGTVLTAPVSAFFGKDQRDANSAAFSRLKTGAYGLAQDAAAANSAVLNQGQADPYNIALGRGIAADAYNPDGTPRAEGRGLGAAVIAGSGGIDRAGTLAGERGRNSRNRLFGQGGVAGGRTDRGGMVVNQTANVTVTGSSLTPHHVKRAVQEALDEKADHIRRNYGRRTQSDDAEPVGGDPDIEGTDDDDN